MVSHLVAGIITMLDVTDTVGGNSSGTSLTIGYIIQNINIH